MTLNFEIPAPASLAAARTAVACARRHGMPDVPDPIIGAHGQVTIPGGTPVPTPAVRSACGALIRAAEAYGSAPTNVSAPDMRALVRYAACLRTHGLPNWPDPNAHGEFHVRSIDAGTRVTGKLANDACRSLAGASMARVTITPNGQ